MNDVKENLISIENRLDKYNEDINYKKDTLEYVDKRLQTNQTIVDKLTNIVDDPEFEIKVKENEEFINEFNKQKKDQLEQLQNERERIEQAIIKLKNKIEELERLVKETEAEIEQRKEAQDILENGKLTKESLLEAAKNMKF